MTIPTLLRRVSIATPRYVTVDGQVVLSEGAPQQSPAYAVRPHKFHDGPEPETPGDGLDAWWKNDDEWDADRNDMARWFPQFVPMDEGGDRFYLGQVDSGRGRFSLAVLPWPDKSIPRIAVLQPKTLGRSAGKDFIKPPHLYLSGALCLADKDDWKSGYSTAVAVGWAAHWLACYTEWRMNGGVWPSDGYVPLAS